jgi:hypothetical protein
MALWVVTSFSNRNFEEYTAFTLLWLLKPVIVNEIHVFLGYTGISFECFEGYHTKLNIT